MNSNPSECKKTTCPYCGVGCGVDAQITETGTITVKGSDEHPANKGRLCVKGSALADSVTNRNRLLHPEIQGKSVSWETAFSEVADRFTETIRQHGPDSVAFYLSGQLLTEDYYVANKLMKGFLGSANVDTNSRLCMSSAVVGYKRAFGADAVPGCYEDLEHCNLAVLTGSNAAWTHPVLFQRLVAAKAARPEMKIIVIDPRATATSEIADLHLALNPGSDAFLFNGLFNYLVSNKHVDEDFVSAHCEGLERAAALAATCSLDAVAEATGIPCDSLREFYAVFAQQEKVVTLYSQGVNQSTSGSDKCNAIINCHLLSGKIGKSGMGPFSLTGQPNAMGGREVGGLANQLAAHMDFTPANVDRVGRFWGASNMATRPGLKAVDLFDAIDTGTVKAVWIMATNPVVSLPDSDKVRAALEKCDLVVVSDCVRHTDTNALADVLLPALGWGEKDGTVSNSERRISRQRALFPPQGTAKPDWEIICGVAQAMGFTQAFDYSSPRDIFVEHAALSAFENGKTFGSTRVFNISSLQNLSRDEYDALEPIQWPVTPAQPTGTARLFTDGQFNTESGKAALVAVEAARPLVQTSAEFPFLLNTGRLRDQWHTMTRTGYVSKLLAHTDSPQASIHPDSCHRLGVTDGDLVAVQSATGNVVVSVKSDTDIQEGAVFVPIHWSDQFSKSARIGRVVDARVDPHSGQPEFKLAAVNIVPLNIYRWVAVVSSQVLDLTPFSYWHCVPVGDATRYLLALDEHAWQEFDLRRWVIAQITHDNCIEYHDEESGEQRFILTSNGTIDTAVFASSRRAELPGAGWLDKLTSDDCELESWQLLQGRDTDASASGKIICSCFEVDELKIVDAIQSGCCSHEQLGAKLSCGTNCGSCVPELKKLLREHLTEKAA